MEQLDSNLWLLSYPLKMLGADLRRNVAVMRLPSGQMVIHSMGPFSGEDVAAIRALGEPAWLVEAMLRHDTFSQEGRDAFSTATFLAPEGFGERVKFPVGPLLPAPTEWAGEIEVLRLEGVPSMEEHAFFHRSSGTLITADLIFNFGADEPLLTEIVLRAAVGSEHEPGMPRPFKLAIKDEPAFCRSLEVLKAWDFDRVIAGHGHPILAGGKPKVLAMLRAAGY